MCWLTKVHNLQSLSHISVACAWKKNTMVYQEIRLLSNALWLLHSLSIDSKVWNVTKSVTWSRKRNYLCLGPKISSECLCCSHVFKVLIKPNWKHDYNGCKQNQFEKWKTLYLLCSQRVLNHSTKFNLKAFAIQLFDK